jgi:pimeloyl-ACP methyl ester carboxylesterase
MNLSETTTVQTGYAPVNGLQMYYEIHGTGHGTNAGIPPLVLLHGAFSAIGTSFAAILPGLAETRQVIGFDLQGHGRTADIDRPLSTRQMAGDTAAALAHLGIDRADILGYSMGSDVALHLVIDHPQLVRKLVLISASYKLSGIHPGLMDGLGEMSPDMMVGSPWHDEYMAIHPNPDHFAEFFAKKTAMDRQMTDYTEEDIRGIHSPTLLIIGDSDLTMPEHAVEMFRLLGGGVFGDMPPGLPDSQLAILPGTSHVSAVTQTDLLLSIIPAFLDRPVN